jgi:hypothetical protein
MIALRIRGRRREFPSPRHLRDRMQEEVSEIPTVVVQVARKSVGM